MLYTLHNLPANTRFQDVKNLLKQKCGITEMILDNLLPEGSGKKVTVGLADEMDAALLMKEVDGLLVCGCQIFIEDLGKKKKQSRASSNVWDNTQKTNEQRNVGFKSETETRNTQNFGNHWELNTESHQSRNNRQNSPEPRAERAYRLDANRHDYDSQYRDHSSERDHGNWKHNPNISSVDRSRDLSYKYANDSPKTYYSDRNDGHERFHDSPRNTNRREEFNVKHRDASKHDRVWDSECWDRQEFKNNDQQYSHYSRNSNSRDHEYDQRDDSRRRGFNEFSRSPQRFEERAEDYKKHNYPETFTTNRPSFTKPKTFPPPENSYVQQKPRSYINIFDDNVQGKINAAVADLAQELSNNIEADVNMNFILRELKKHIRERVYDVFTGKEMSKKEIVLKYRKKYTTSDDRELCEGVLDSVTKEAFAKNNQDERYEQATKRRRF